MIWISALSTRLPWLLALRWNIAKHPACIYLIREQWFLREGGRGGAAGETHIDILVPFPHSRLEWWLYAGHFNSFLDTSSHILKSCKAQNNYLPVTRSACRMRRNFNLFLNLGFSKFSLFSLNAGSNFGNKVSEDPNAVISRRLKIKELGICFLHFLVFPSLHSPQTLSSRLPYCQIHEKVPHALGTGMRFPNPCVSLLWSELEVNATCLGKASCLDWNNSLLFSSKNTESPKGPPVPVTE